MKFILIYLVNVLAFAMPLAVFEIWLEKYKVGPWGATEFKHGFWGKKIHGGNVTFFFIRNILEKEYITPYHIIMFGGIMPSLAVLNYLVIVYVCHSGPLVAIIFGVKIIVPIYLLAILIGNMVLEDFLWFAIQTLTGWRVRSALPRLLRGQFAWHTSWISFGRYKLPRFYILVPVWIFLIFAINYAIVHWSQDY